MEGTVKPAERSGVRGWLFFFAITLVAIGPLVRVVSLFTSYAPVAAVAAQYPRFVVIYAVTCFVEVALIAWSVMAGAAILNARPHAKRLATWFLLMNPIVMFLCTIAYGLADLPPSAMDVISRVGAALTARAVLYSIIWGLYLKLSRRVRETFPGAVKGPSAPKVAVAR